VLVSPGYVAEQSFLHAQQPAYGSRGFNWGYLIAGIAVIEGGNSILDYGCGKGTLTRTLRDAQFDVRQYDPAIPSCALPPKPADIVAVLDVMEHIEPDCLDAVLIDLVRVTRRILFVTISTTPSKRWMRDGRNTHLIVMDGKWWRQQFERMGFRVRREWQTGLPEWVAMMNSPHSSC
jgi:hypothetical protein